MTIRKSLLAGFAALVALGALQGTAALLSNASLQRDIAAQADRLAAVDYAASAQLAFERADRAAQDSKRATDIKSAVHLSERFRSEASHVHTALQAAAVLEPRLRLLVGAASDWLHQVDLRLEGSNTGPQTELLREDLLEDRRDARQREIAATVATMLKSSSELRNAAEQAAVRVQVAIFTLVLLSLAGGVSLAVMLHRRVLRPLAALTQATRQLTTGDLDRSVEGTARDDEIGSVATALEALRRGTLHARSIEATAAADRSVAEARVRYLAHHDPLTGLPNRALLEQRLERAAAQTGRAGSSMALLCIDLDGFKAVNDSYGHAAGDMLLREAARRLLRTVRETDTVARVGGDEFIVVLSPESLTSDLVECVARRIIDTLADFYDVGEGRQAVVTASVGISLFPDDGISFDGLLGNADMAMYRVKQSGRNGFAFFRSEMDAEAQTRRSLEQDIRLATTRGQLSLVYQPQVDLQSDEVVGFEALLRWRHPERGQVPPDLFISVAEASGSIVPIGAWVLREACLEAARWTKPLRVAVNVSPIQFQQCDMTGLVADTLSATGLAPSRLELEVTEGILIRDPAATLGTLRRIRDLGVCIAMDDFGTGYSSLSSLRAFPFDRLKIDRSFIRDLATSREAAAIVHAVMGLAHGLDLPVVAEGVESEDQLTMLRAARCAEVQGYLCGRPAPIGAFHGITHPVPARELA